jgi:hypothetical protein
MIGIADSSPAMTARVDGKVTTAVPCELQQAHVRCLLDGPEINSIPMAPALLFACRVVSRSLRRVKGQNIQIGLRWPGSDVERVRALAKELVRLKSRQPRGRSRLHVA